ncbi:MAG: carbohydrate-binding family 9-like protein [Duncaniella sp.]|nr:carbohydrate-binding family 9-like protein [Muribaculum sp.]MCM1256137.1 carbohydrate-binding family 9-like protein [Duncaniella sp.]
MDKVLQVPYISDLDFLNTEAIFNRLETSGERHTIESVNWKELYPYHPLTTFTTAHSDKYLYVNFFVRCNYLRAMNIRTNDPVDEDSSVALFIGKAGEEWYYSFYVNCIGVIKAAKNSPVVGSQLLDEKVIDQIAVLPSCGTRPFQEVEGLFTWDVLVAIPLQLLGVNFDGSEVELHGNFYKCASGSSQPHFLSWAPIDTASPDFHQPKFFGKIVLM